MKVETRQLRVDCGLRGPGECSGKKSISPSQSTLRSDPLADVLTTEQRRLNMSRVRGRDTKPEMVIRRGLHARGLRFRLHCKDLPGRPDLVFPKYRTVVFVHGCFWHAHDCPMFKWPQTRKESWRGKINKNLERDRLAISRLKDQGWRVLTGWACALKGPGRCSLDDVLQRCEDFVLDTAQEIDAIGGTLAG